MAFVTELVRLESTIKLLLSVTVATSNSSIALDAPLGILTVSPTTKPWL